jgi:hypothetical protein
MKISSLEKETDVVWFWVGVVDNPNYLMTSIDMRLFWIPLSTIACSGVLFTHIYE